MSVIIFQELTYFQQYFKFIVGTNLLYLKGKSHPDYMSSK